MKTARYASLAALVVLAAGVWVGCEGESQARHGEVTINGRTWRVEIAMTQADRYRGLSGRRTLADDEGMLFIFPSERMRGFCMRDCLIPLDIAFIDEDLCVVRTDTMIVEEGLAGSETYRSQAPAQYVLEVAAGQLAGVRVGDRVEFSRHVPDPAKAEP